MIMFSWRWLLACLLISVATRASGEPLTFSSHGCMVISLRSGKVAAPPLMFAKPSAQLVRYFNLGELYAWAPPLLTAAFDQAEQGFTGYRSGVLGDLSARLVILPEGFPYIGVTRNGTSVDIYCTAGLLDLVQVSTSALMLDILREREAATPEGIGLDEWLFRLCADLDTTGAYRVAWAGAQSLPNRTWAVNYSLAPAAVVYRFIFAHELAHVWSGISSSTVDPLLTEMRADSLAFASLWRDGQTIPTVILTADPSPNPGTGQVTTACGLV
jgi:hypothetical protein